MKRFMTVVTAVLFLVSLASAVPDAEARGRHRGGGFSSSFVGISGFSGYGGPSLFIGGSSPGFSFFIGSGPSHGYGRTYYGKHYRGHRYGRHEYRRYNRDRHFDRPYGRYGGYSRRGVGRHYGPVRPYVVQPPGTQRHWVPGRNTPRGYAWGYWEYR